MPSTPAFERETTAPILITRPDRRRLQAAIDALRARPGHDPGLDVLQLEIDLAAVVDPLQVPPTVVTINTRVELVDLDSGERLVVTVILPRATPAPPGGVSVLAPEGMALLGARVGQEVSWPRRGGKRRLRIERVLYQPEADPQFRATLGPPGPPRSAPPSRSSGRGPGSRRSPPARTPTAHGRRRRRTRRRGRRARAPKPA